MRLRFLLAAALLGGVVLLAWSLVSHGSGIFPGSQAKSFKDSTAVIETVKANAPSNGVYFEGRGLFAAVAFRPDMGQKFTSLVGPLGRQLLIECIVAFLLAWLLLRLPVWSAMGTGSLFATVGLAAGIAVLLSQSNWYGFALSFQLAELADLVIGWFLVGVVIGSLRNRMLRPTG